MKIIFVCAALIFLSLEGVRAGGPSPLGPCDQAIDQGDEPCDDSRADFVWFYFESQGICVTLEYTGCGGNDNRFESEADCMMECVQP